jgi:GNAT superfamily N-acetyltransferase
LGVTEASIVEMISASSCGWVAVVNNEIVGFSLVDVPNAALFAAFMLPAYEGNGVGTRLVAVAERELFKHHSVIWLETDKRSRAAGFYQRLGWGNERATEGSEFGLQSTALRGLEARSTIAWLFISFSR